MRPTLILLFVALIVGMVVPDAAQAEDRPVQTPPEPLRATDTQADVISTALAEIVADEQPATPPVNVEPPPPAAPEPEPEPVAEQSPAPALVAAVSGSVRDRALAQFARLGATGWQISVFDCIGYHESGWQSKRSNKQNSNGTWDNGPMQINDIHWPTLNRLGLDPYVPEDAAVYAWRLSSEGHNFKPWSVAASCGV